MKSTTFQLLKRAALHDVDKTALLEAKSQESDPFIHHLINVALNYTFIRVPWDTTSFTTQFRSVPPRQRLDETVITFLLRIASILKYEMYWRAFEKPQSQQVVVSWTHVLKQCIFATLSLLYNVEWSVESLFQLDAAILKLLHEGKSIALREFMQHDLKIAFASDQIFPAETTFEKLYSLNVVQFGSFYWRLLHWMAEAMDTKQRQPFARSVWLELMTTGPLYRTLLCGICMFHLRELVTEFQSAMMDEETNQARLWFDIHNRVHAKRRSVQDNYPEAEYEKDADYMRQVLK